MKKIKAKTVWISFYYLFSDQIAVRQSQVDKLYAGLKDLARERKSKLEEVLKLYILNREIDDLMQWIAEREIVAGSHELGQDFEHVTVSIGLFTHIIRHDQLHTLHSGTPITVLEESKLRQTLTEAEYTLMTEERKENVIAIL